MYIPISIATDLKEYIGVTGGDGDPWEYFNVYDIKENENYVLIHAACYTGNNGGGENVYRYTANILFEKRPNNENVFGMSIVYVETYQNDITDNIASIKASSQLANYQNKTYGAENLIDKSPKTAWVENAEGVGIGEFIQIKLKKDTWVQELGIHNGYQASEDLFEKNGYVTKVTVDFGNGVVKEQECQQVWYYGDISDSVGYSMNLISLEQPVHTHVITITILDAEKGNKYSDTCISEIEIH